MITLAAKFKWLMALGLLVVVGTGCESTDGGGSVYYGVGYYDPWYYGDYYYDRDIVVTPPPPRPTHPIAPTPVPRPTPMPSIPSMPRPAMRR